MTTVYYLSFKGGQSTLLTLNKEERRYHNFYLDNMIRVDIKDDKVLSWKEAVPSIKADEGDYFVTQNAYGGFTTNIPFTNEQEKKFAKEFFNSDINGMYHIK